MQPMPRMPALDLSNSGARSNAGGRSDNGMIRRQGSGVDPKDKSAQQSMHGGLEHEQGGGDSSPKIGAYNGPISSITKHYFMVRSICLQPIYDTACLH